MNGILNVVHPEFQRATPRLAGDSLRALGFIHMTGLTVQADSGTPMGLTTVGLQAKRDFAGKWTRICNDSLVVAILPNGEIWMSGASPKFDGGEAPITEMALETMCPLGFIPNLVNAHWHAFISNRGDAWSLAITAEKVMDRYSRPMSARYGSPVPEFVE